MTDILIYRLNCPACDWSQRVGEHEVGEMLRQLGKVRASRDPEWEILRELLLSSLSKLICPECEQKGLVAAPLQDDADEEWDDDLPTHRACEGCQHPIPAERLTAIPSAKLCARCQEADECGELRGEVDYCPRCGSPMEVRPSRGAGITRYKMVCSAGSRCR